MRSKKRALVRDLVLSVVLMALVTMYVVPANVEPMDDLEAMSTKDFESFMDWDIEKVYEGGNYDPSMVLDEDDNPHILFRGEERYTYFYTRWTGSEWEVNEMDEDISEDCYPGIDVDSEGNLHIAYIYDEYGSNYMLNYTRWTAGAWETETLDCDSIFDSAGSASLKLDKNDELHIAYAKAESMIQPHTLVYTTWTGTEWVSETVDHNSNKWVCAPDIAVDSNNSPHIIYSEFYDSDVLKYAKKVGDSWVNETIEEGDFGGYCLAIDSDDNPHICYSEYWNSSLRYARWTGSGWEIEEIYDDFWAGLNLELDSDDNPHVTFTDQDSDPMYARLTESSWEIEIMDIGELDNTYYISSDIDSQDKVHIAYYDEDKESIMHAVGTEGTSGTKPTEPLNLRKSIGDEEVSLSWDPPADNGGSSITEYNIYRGTISGSLNSYDSVDGSITTYTDNDVTNDQKYYYAVSAVNNAGESELSDEVSATPTSEPDTVPPDADAGDDMTVEVGEEFTLDSSGSSDNIGIECCEWDLDNGETKTGTKCTYKYDEEGTYTVELTVTDENGNIDTDTVVITVEQVVDDDGDGNGDGDEGTPGFTLLLFLISMVALTILYRKRYN